MAEQLTVKKPASTAVSFRSVCNVESVRMNAAAPASAAKVTYKPIATTSRLNHDLRQPRNARQALSGWPRCIEPAQIARPPANGATRSNDDECGIRSAATLMPTASCDNTSNA